VPREALEQAIRHKDAITPKLIDVINYIRTHAQDILEKKDPYYAGHIHALYLLAQFREKTACKPIIDLFATLPENIIDTLFGDIITEDLNRILASVSSGDDALIRSLVEQETAPEYVRGAAIASFITMVVTSLKSRQEVIDYYSLLFTERLKRQNSFVWGELVASAVDIRARDLLEEIQKAYNEGLFDFTFIGMNEITQEMKKSPDAALKNLASSKRHSLISNTIEEMEKWESYKNSNKYNNKTLAGDSIPDLKPVRTTPKIGRNDPCPCGSGKKYKKCCGKNV